MSIKKTLDKAIRMLDEETPREVEETYKGVYIRLKWSSDNKVTIHLGDRVWKRDADYGSAREAIAAAKEEVDRMKR